MKTGRAALFAALFLCFGGLAANAQDVTLTSRDGAVEITGTLLGFDGEFYRVETIYGELTVDGAGVSCEGPGCPSLQDFVPEISISGSVTMGAVMMPALLEAFAQRNGYKAERVELDSTHFRYHLEDANTRKLAALFSFRVTNSDEGFADLLANEADVVMSLREVTETEKARALEAGIGDLSAQNRTRVLALDAIVPIVSPQNPVREISPLNLARAYAGEIANWSMLGGADAPIVLHAPASDTGLGQAAQNQLMAPADMLMSESVTRHIRGSALADAVYRDPFALGLASFADVGRTQPLVLKGACGRLLTASRRSIKTEDYPMTAPMFLYTPARRLPRVGRAFLSFAHSQPAQIVIRRAGFVDQALEEVPLRAQGDRFINAISAAGSEISLTELQRMADRLLPMKRLTLSFRFEAGSSRLDAQSRSNVVQLAHSLGQGLFDARTFFLIGFSDGDGPADRNRQIALSRAEAVRSGIVQAAETADLEQVQISVDAFGEAMPLACDDSAWGRKANRRVEVWVR